MPRFHRGTKRKTLSPAFSIPSYLEVRIRPRKEDIFPMQKDTEKDTVKDTEQGSLILQDNEKKALEEIRKNPRITAEQLSKILGINLRNTKKYFANLKKKGLLRRIGPDKGGHWEVLKK